MKWIFPAVAVAALVSPTLPAYAAGPFDGTWVFEAPAAKGGGANYDLEECNPVRFQAQIKDNKVVGNLRREVYPQSGPNVQSTPGRGATPIQGSVAPDGNLTASWQSYHATGHLTGDKGELTWKGQCGPRVATATRTAQPAAALSGTSVPPSVPREHQIYFGFDKATMTPDSQKAIQQAADEARANPNARITVTGKADRVGTDAYNMKLSERRAETVSQALISAGVPADRIQARGVGESEPPVPTRDGAKEPKNRVADVVMQ
jgi:outer membrane protein OmpA-like peptidoglycan-associated protein